MSGAGGTGPANDEVDASGFLTDGAYGTGLATVTPDGTVLDVWYPAPALLTVRQARSSNPSCGSPSGPTTSAGSGCRCPRPGSPRWPMARSTPRTPTCGCTCCPRGWSGPRSINLDGIFAVLPNNAWTSLGPVPPEDVERVRLDAVIAGVRLSVFGVDKFPRMTDYVLPSGVRIAHADRVRLGAHLAAGTTVMHEGFCNYNAGTIGTSMVEGRISQGVVVGDGSDVGGGASIMGTLSGGGKEQVTIGRGLPARRELRGRHLAR